MIDGKLRSVRDVPGVARADLEDLISTQLDRAVAAGEVVSHHVTVDGHAFVARIREQESKLELVLIPMESQRE